ncbi:MAG TPA: hypothetical protein VFS39_02220 [Nitrospira sp.]|nr:hypothetical protein [Nitrospira sp.]
MRRTAVVALALLLPAAVAAGCGSHSYVPDISLAQVRPVIDATAEFHGLYPAPPVLSGQDRFGVEAEQVDKPDVAQLADQVEGELYSELQKTGPFMNLTRYAPQPDVVLTGRIDAFYERYRQRLWTRIPGIGPVADVLDLKTHASSGEADLTLFVLRPDGEVIGRYRGRSSFTETFNPTRQVPPGSRLNRALSHAVRQIQEQIVQDANVRKIAARQGE